LKIFDGIASLISGNLTRFDQKLIDGSTKPIGGYFPKNIAVDLISNCHNLTPNLVALYN